MPWPQHRNNRSAPINWRFTIQGSAGYYNIESYLNPDQEITVVRNGRMGGDLVYPTKDEESAKQP